MFINTVPDVEHLIFSYLTAKDMCHAHQVNKQWKVNIDKDDLWNHFFPKLTTIIRIPLKEHFNVRGITSYQGVIQRIEHFLSKMQAKENGAFICYFPNSRCHINIKMGKPILSKLDIKETYWFLEVPCSKEPIIDMFTLSRTRKKFFIHLRLPKDLSAISNQITKLVADHEKH